MKNIISIVFNVFEIAVAHYISNSVFSTSFRVHGKLLNAFYYCNYLEKVSSSVSILQVLDIRCVYFISLGKKIIKIL